MQISAAVLRSGADNFLTDVSTVNVSYVRSLRAPVGKPSWTDCATPTSRITC